MCSCFKESADHLEEEARQIREQYGVEVDFLVIGYKTRTERSQGIEALEKFAAQPLSISIRIREFSWTPAVSRPVEASNAEVESSSSSTSIIEPSDLPPSLGPMPFGGPGLDGLTLHALMGHRNGQQKF